MESIEGDMKNTRRLLKDLDPLKSNVPNKVSPYVLRECAETLDRSLKMFKNSLEEGS